MPDDTQTPTFASESASEYDSPEDYPEGFQWSGADPDAPGAVWKPDPDTDGDALDEPAAGAEDTDTGMVAGDRGAADAAGTAGDDPEEAEPQPAAAPADYTPSWAQESTSEYDSPEDYPGGFRHGPGLDHTDTWEGPKGAGGTPLSEKRKERERWREARPPEEERWGEPRHIALRLGFRTESMAGVQRLPDPEIDLVHEDPYCRYIIRSEDAAFPPESEGYRLHIEGPREGDSDTIDDVEVVDADPLTIDTGEPRESGTLFRIYYGGCVRCQLDAREDTDGAEE